MLTIYVVTPIAPTRRWASVLTNKPAGEIDAATAHELMVLLRVLNQEGHTFIIVTRDRRVSPQIDCTAYLQDGCVARDRATGADAVQRLTSAAMH